MKLSEIRDPNRWKRHKYLDGDKAFAENPVSHKIEPVKITAGPFMGKMYQVSYDGDPDEGYGIWAEDDTGLWASKEEGERAIFNRKLAGKDEKVPAIHGKRQPFRTMTEMKLKDIKEDHISDYRLEYDAALNTLAEQLAKEIIAVIRSRPNPSENTIKGMSDYVIGATVEKLQERTKQFVEQKRAENL